MSDNDQTTESPESELAAASAGKLLASAREKAGLSVEDVSTKLRLSARQIQALEDDDATALPGAMFVRGFIRNYSKLLGVDAEVVLAAYQVSAPESVGNNITLQYENIPIVSHDKKNWLPYMIASGVVAIALGGWMIYMEYAAQESHKAAAEKVVAEKTVTPAVAVPEPVVPQVTPEAVATINVQDEKAAESANLAILSPAGSIQLNFAEQSWVSVNDKEGKEIFNKTQSAGTQATVEGVPPFKIVVGNAKGVNLSYKDKPVDLLTIAKANVARLTLE